MADRAVNPYKSEHHRDAWDQGYAAGEAGKGDHDAPAGDYPRRSHRKAWLLGWEAGRDNRPAPPPAVRVQEVQVRVAGERWPEGEPLPSHYVKRKLIPCVVCRALRDQHKMQAVVCKSTSYDGQVAYVRCRVCAAGWSMPVREV